MAAALSVVTWNIRAAIGPGPFPDRWWSRIDADRLRAIGSFIAGLEADVVALQEVALVRRDGDLARQLGMEVRYGAVRTFLVADGGAVTGAGCFGNALLSRLPIARSRTVALPMAPADAFVEPPDADHPAAGIRYADAPDHVREPRCLLLADVAGIAVGTAHLSHIGAGERLLQAEATVAAFGDAPSAVLLGDLNSAIEASELAPFAGWADGFSEPPGDRARVSTDDGSRIDHVLARGASVRDSTARLRVRWLNESSLTIEYPAGATVEQRDTVARFYDQRVRVVYRAAEIGRAHV